ncbi:MAG: holo-ACP synthase [Holophagales bacterium]|jgi:holo-[acyl-carrier protein] synthase|nr:holo-ACP synthase [Holophagales bacterium]
MMIIGVGVDLCQSSRWQRLLDRYGERSLRRMLSEEEVFFLLSGSPKCLAERAAGRWALREAVGKAMGVGLSGWNLRELRYSENGVKTLGSLKKKLESLGVDKIHATISHDGGLSVALVVLEKKT